MKCLVEVRGKELFEEDMDYQIFLEILKSELEKYNCILHAYCLMTNHVYLLFGNNRYRNCKIYEVLIRKRFIKQLYST